MKINWTSQIFVQFSHEATAQGFLIAARGSITASFYVVCWTKLLPNAVGSKSKTRCSTRKSFWCHSSTLISLALAMFAIVSSISSSSFRGSYQQLLPGFVTRKGKQGLQWNPKTDWHWEVGKMDGFDDLRNEIWAIQLLYKVNTQISQSFFMNLTQLFKPHSDMLENGLCQR